MKKDKAFYVRKFKEYKRSMKSLGMNGDDMTIKSVNEFKANYDAISDDIKSEAKAGLRKTKYGDVVKRIVNEDAYSLDYKTALAMKEKFKERGEDVKLGDLRKIKRNQNWEEMLDRDINGTKFRDILSDEYKELRRKGMSKEAAGAFISEHWFGSK